MKELTAEEVRRLFEYDPVTGNLIWRSDKKLRRSGKIAGCSDNNGYIVLKVAGKKYYAHRLIWLWSFGEFPEKSIDHINGHPYDNRLINLRLATSQENHQNQKINMCTYSGFKGVTYIKSTGHWCVHITINDKTTYHGTYTSKEAAIKARIAIELKYFGKFSRHYKSESISLEVI